MKPHERIRSYRRTHEIPPGELAKALGIAEPTLRSIENGHRKIAAELAVKVENVTGIRRSLLRPDLWSEPADPTPAPSQEAAA